MLAERGPCRAAGSEGEAGANVSVRCQQRIRRDFFRALMRGLTVIWPVLSGLIALKLSLGAAVGLIERWGVGKGIYFAVVTGLTIGYGDLVPTGALTRILAVTIGVCGIVITALVAALAVDALRSATAEPRTPARSENQRRE